MTMCHAHLTLPRTLQCGAICHLIVKHTYLLASIISHVTHLMPAVHNFHPSSFIVCNRCLKHDACQQACCHIIGVHTQHSKCHGPVSCKDRRYIRAPVLCRAAAVYSQLQCRRSHMPAVLPANTLCLRDISGRDSLLSGLLPGAAC
jgi:hypothetical protein